MKKYTNPMIEMLVLTSMDIITNSIGLLDSDEGSGEVKKLSEFINI